MTVRRALLCGLNYAGTACALRGCANDVADVADALVAEHGFRRADVETLLEPTAARILERLRALAAASWDDGGDGGLVYFHFSGHGTSVRDADGDEADGLDEAIVPADYRASGVILDDTLREVVCGFRPGTRVVCVFDCCHSGTALDLPWASDARAAPAAPRPWRGPDVVALSGCRDDQTSADACFGGRAQGALTYGLLRVMRPGTRALELRARLADELRRAGFGQVPVLSASRAVGPDEPFMPAVVRT